MFFTQIGTLWYYEIFCGCFDSYFHGQIKYKIKEGAC